jgi:hypothetical protein
MWKGKKRALLAFPFYEFPHETVERAQNADAEDIEEDGFHANDGTEADVGDDGSVSTQLMGIDLDVYQFQVVPLVSVRCQCRHLYGLHVRLEQGAVGLGIGQCGYAVAVAGIMVAARARCGKASALGEQQRQGVHVFKNFPFRKTYVLKEFPAVYLVPGVGVSPTFSLVPVVADVGVDGLFKCQAVLFAGTFVFLDGKFYEVQFLVSLQKTD